MLLPTAEKIYVEGLEDEAPADGFFDGDENKGIPMPGYIFFIWFFIMTAILVMGNHKLFMVLFGLFFIFFGLSGGGRRRIGIRNFRSNFKRNPVFPIAGFVIILIGRFADMKGLDEDQERTSELIGAVFFGGLGLLILGSLTFFILRAAAISKRKKECTYFVTAVHYGYKDPKKRSAGTGLPTSMVGYPTYKYYYRGEIFRLTLTERIPAFFDHDLVLELYVDPKQPDCYYCEEIFSRNGKKIKLLLKITVFLVAVCAALMALVYYAE